MTALANRHTLTVEQTAQILGVGRSACYAAVNRGEILASRSAAGDWSPAPSSEPMPGLGPEDDHMLEG